MQEELERIIEDGIRRLEFAEESFPGDREICAQALASWNLALALKREQVIEMLNTFRLEGRRLLIREGEGGTVKVYVDTLDAIHELLQRR